MIQIKHGIPQHDVFTIALPYKDEYKSLMRTDSVTEITLRHPNNGSVSKAKSLFGIQIDLNHEPIPSAMTYLAYGVHPDTLLDMMLKKYPEIRQHKQIVFLILEKIT